MTNCPNCGAPITSSQCEYCDTRFPNFAPPEPLTYNEEIIKLIQDGRMTPNEARECVGLKRLKEERYVLENRLLAAKTRAMEYNGAMRKLYEDALKAMRGYSGSY